MKRCLGIFFLCVVLGQATAQSPAHKAPKISESIKHKIQAQVHALLPDQTIDAVSDSPIPGLYEVAVGSMVFYASQDGRYLVMGDILDASKHESDRSLTERSRQRARAVVWKTFKGDGGVRYVPKEVKGLVSIFVDPDCGYCQKLHEEIPALLDLGIQVNYIAFPRQGVGSPTFDKLVSIWCSKNPNAAMDQVMKNQPIEAATCQNKVEADFLFAQKLGVGGTPAMVFADGTLSVGYRPAKAIAELALQHHAK